MNEHCVNDKQTSSPPINIGVAMPSHGIIYARTALNLAALASYFGMNRIGNCAAQRLHILSSSGSMIGHQRDTCVMMAKRSKCDYILFIDGDQTFPRDVLHKWVPMDKDIIGANIPIKQIPSRPTAVGTDGKLIFTDEDSTGLTEAMQVGTGMLMIKVSVFDKLERPWFYQEWNPVAQAPMGEDVYFCLKARRAGYKVWIDQDVSKHVGHIGDFEYTHELVGDLSEVNDNV